MKKKLLLILNFLLFFLLSITLMVKPINAVTEIPKRDKITVHLFSSPSCPHCSHEKDFLAYELSEDTVFKVNVYSTANQQNIKLLKAVGEKLNVDTKGVPFTVVGDNYVVGFGGNTTTGQEILELVNNYQAELDTDVVKQIINEQNIIPFIENLKPRERTKEMVENTALEDGEIKLPIIGIINYKSYSLPVITFLIALVDGFNPCAMWTLLFLITLFLNMEDRRKMFILGTAFIVTSGFVYFLLLKAWLDLFKIISVASTTRYLIGFFAVGVGIYFIRDYQVNKEGACTVDLGGKKKKVFKSLKKIVHQPNFLILLIGIIVLAFAVNIVEAVCSAGLPAIYTQVLAYNNLSAIQYNFYLLFYVTVFMIDDLVVFVVAMITLKKMSFSGKLSRYSHLIGGIIMIMIGLGLIFKPGLLMFA